MRFRYHCHMLVVFALLLLVLTATDGTARDPAARTTGQTVYVPAYSHIYHGNREAQLLLSVTLSIRNVDPDIPISISVVDYYETQGKLLKNFVTSPVTLAPLGSERYVIPQDDSSGGSGANFIVVWEAERPTNPPIIETVMIGSQSQLGISFTSRGQALQP
jgi:hypothetical protein